MNNKAFNTVSFCTIMHCHGNLVLVRNPSHAPNSEVFYRSLGGQWATGGERGRQYYFVTMYMCNLRTTYDGAGDID